jgi:small subunit ribosomal protein S6
MKGYELLYIVGTQFTDEEIAGIQSKIDGMLTQAGANVLKTQNLGKIKLAYPIQNLRHGSYVLSYFDAEPSVIADVNRRLGLTEEVLRHTLLARPEDALTRTFELTSYVAPLSEEARSEREMKRASTRTFKKPDIALPPPTPVSRQESTMSMEELDQKLDKILEGDIAENI